MTTARHKAVDQIRRRVLAEKKQEDMIAALTPEENAPVPQDTLRLIFTCCRTELRFTHAGLAPGVACYDACSGAWRFHVRDSLRRLITKGKGEPNPRE